MGLSGIFRQRGLLAVLVGFGPHLSNDWSQDRVACRCRSLDGERGGWAVAGDAGLTELSPRSLRECELCGVSVRRTASQPCALLPTQGPAGCGLRARRAG